MYCEGLTKEQLLKWGFTDVELNSGETDPKKQFTIKRLWRKNSSKLPHQKVIAITEAVGRHKYTPDKVYLKITFNGGKGPKTITLARFIYVWFNGDLADGEVVDHIDNNSFNNDPKNLRKLSVRDNLIKRNEDNYKYARNQYEVEFGQLLAKLYDPAISVEESNKIFKEYLEMKHNNGKSN